MEPIMPDCPSNATSNRLAEFMQHLHDSHKASSCGLFSEFPDLPEILHNLHLKHQNLSRLVQGQKAALQRLNADKEFFRGYFNNAPNPCLITDANGIIQEVNRSAEKFFSGRTIRLVGRSLSVFISSPERKRFRSRLVRLGATKPTKNSNRKLDWGSFPIRVHQLAPRSSSFHVLPFFDEKGSLKQIRWMLRVNRDKALESKPKEAIYSQSVSASTSVPEISRSKEEADRLALERLGYLENTQDMIRLSKDILAAKSVDVLLQRVLHAARKITNAEMGACGYGFANGRFAIGLISKDSQKPKRVPGEHFCFLQGELREKLVTKQTTVRLTQEEYALNPGFAETPSGHPILQGLLGAPLIGNTGKTTGVILLSKKTGGDFTAEDEVLLNHMTTIASLGLRHIETVNEARQKTNELDIIFDSLTDPVIIYNRDSIAIKANAAATAITGQNSGFSRDEVMSKLSVRHLNGHQVATEDFPTAQALTKGITSGRRFRFSVPEIGERIFAVCSSPIIQNEVITGAVCVMHDTTIAENLLTQLRQERRKAEQRAREAEEAGRLFNAIMENVPEGIVIADAPTMSLRMVSRHAANQITQQKEPGEQQDDITGFFKNWKPSGSFHEKPCSLISFPLLRAMQTGENVQDKEWTIENPDGAKSTVLCNAVPVRDQEGRITEGVLVWRDITARKHHEMELRKTANELKRSNKDLEQFAYVASHDLQEPLRSISIHLQLLKRRYLQNIHPEAQEFITCAIDGAVSMSQMINDLLTFSRAGTRSDRLKHAKTGEILRETLAGIRASILEAKAIVLPGDLPEVVCDASQLAQVFQNLITNAIKFRRNEPPRIRIQATEEIDAWVFSIADNGIGIDPKHHSRIFQIFERLHDQKDFKGTGIGLAVCKKIVERHGGRIWLESKVGRGTTFFFSLPKNPLIHDHKDHSQE